jgi:glucose/arabinose dehydrogenase
MRCRLAVLLALLASATVRADSLSGSGSPSPASLFTVQADFLTELGDVTDFRWLPDGRLVVINKGGTVVVRPAGGGSLVTAGTFNVDTSSEKGLLGIAVDPSFTTNRRLYFYYSASGGSGSDKHRVVMRTLRTADSMLDAGETVLLSGLRGPANHDGGGIDIGPDGLLYAGVGDTGCNSGQATEPIYTPTNFYGTCLADAGANHGGGNGKVLRIGLDASIPPSNPLVGATNVTACGASCGDPIDPGMLGSPRPEIFAWGFRNPFRLWVDPMTGRVWVGDVGEITFEEVTIVSPGRHHGWPWREGAKGWPASKCQDVRSGTGAMSAPIQDLDCVDPVYFCAHGSEPGVDGGCQAVTGGQIVDSCTWPDPFRGRYVFGDSSTASLWTLTPNGARDGIVGGRENFASISGAPVAIRVGNDGALYVAVYDQGRIARIAPQTPVPCTTVCASDTECDDADPCTTDHCEPLVIGCTHTAVTPCGGPGASTTTTTLIGPCADQTGPALAKCEVDQARSGAPCDSGIIDARFATKVDTALARASTILGQATITSKPKKLKVLLNRADRRLKSILQIAARADRKSQIDAGCRGQVEDLVDRLRTVVAAARS